MIIDCISDLHGYYPQLEGGDLLIVAGDLTAKDTYEEHRDFIIWLLERSIYYKKCIYIAGNHDNFLDTKTFAYGPLKTSTHVEYLCDSETEFEGLKIWGSPWTRKFKGQNPKAMAFTCDTEEELAEKWALIPEDTDILITHSAPYGMFDEVQRTNDNYWEHVGSTSLLSRWVKTDARLHIFGHIHEGYGIEEDEDRAGFYINASHVNERYEPVNKPIRIEL